MGSLYKKKEVNMTRNVFGYNYPMGAENDPNAPWNERAQENEPREVEVEYSVILRKKVKVSTTDYTIDRWDETERDEDGFVIHCDGEDVDYSETDFLAEYKEQHETPKDLIIRLKAELMLLLRDKPGCVGAKDGTWERLIKECEQWVEEEEIVEQV